MYSGRWSIWANGGDKWCTTYLTGLSFELWKIANLDLGSGDKGCTAYLTGLSCEIWMIANLDLRVETKGVLHI